MSRFTPVTLPRIRNERRELQVERFPQPDDVTCGPTCLMQIYRYYGDEASFPEVVAGTLRNSDGGTLGVYLGLSALRRGYRATIYPFDLRIFDPSWFDLAPSALIEKLELRSKYLEDPRRKESMQAWKLFLECGGRVLFPEPSPEVLVDIIDRGHPIICGLSATWLYRQQRERPDDNVDDDIAGEPAGHFVVICGYSGRGKRFYVRDPSSHVPFSSDGQYVVPAQRLINAILLGDATQDAVLLELSPGEGR